MSICNPRIPTSRREVEVGELESLRARWPGVCNAGRGWESQQNFSPILQIALHLTDYFLGYTGAFHEVPFVKCWPYFLSISILLRNSLPTPSVSCSMFPSFSSCSFSFGLMLRSPTHLELSFVQSERQGFSFIFFLHVDIQVQLSTSLMKMLSLLHCFAVSSKDLNLGFLILFH